MGVRRRGARRGGAGKAAAAAAGEADEAGEATPQPQQPSRGASRSASGLKPDADEVLAAIETLYVDGLKPFGRILRKRLAERAAPAIAREELEQPRTEKGKAKGGSSLPDIDVKHLHGVCEESEELEVRPEEGGDWSAVFVDRAEDFVDIYSSVDTYSEEFWADASSYFGALTKEAMLLPGGRYSCAQMLMARHVPFLEGFSLGQVCHFVQLAISKRKVLGYSDGSVVPYAFSQSMVKEQCANCQKPCAAPGAGEDGAAAMPFATWEIARKCLHEILEEAALPEQGPSTVPLSNVKRLFRSRYHAELSETALGHSKLSELLQDKRFSDICAVQLQGQGYIVVQVANPSPAAIAEAAAAMADDWDDKEQEGGSALEAAPQGTPIGSMASDLHVPLQPVLEDILRGSVAAPEADAEDWQPGALPTFTPQPSPGVPPSCTVRRWNANLAQAAAAAAAISTSLFEQSLFNDMLPPATAPEEARRVEFRSATGEPLVLEGLELFTEGGDREPRRVAVEGDYGESGATPLSSPSMPNAVRRWPQGPCCQILQPSMLWNHDIAAQLSPQPPQPVAARGAAVARSPGVRWQVQNTFIHAACPPTPLPGALRRSQSVPRDMGSSAAAAEEEAVAEARPCDSAAESTADNASAASGAELPPASPAPSSPERPRSDGGAEGAGAMPAKVAVEQLSSLRPSPDDGQQTPRWRRGLLCPELEDGGSIFGVDATPKVRRPPCGTPTKSREGGCLVVQNTFIHAKAAPPTPAPGAKFRARSVPKDVGSEVRLVATPAGAAPTAPIGRSYAEAERELDPAFVPPSPALVPPTPQTPLYSRGIIGWAGSGLTKVRTPLAAVADQRVLRLSDYL